MRYTLLILLLIVPIHLQSQENKGGSKKNCLNREVDPLKSWTEESASQWPSLRGPGNYGVALAANTMTHWDVETGEGIEWSVEVPLAGFNSPIVWDNRIFLTGEDGTRHGVYCFDANTGNQLWFREVEMSVPPPRVSRDAGLAAPTMTTDGKLVFAIFATGELAALDFDGKPVWQKNLGLPDNTYGMGSSLICDGRRLFIQYDHHSSQRVIALDCDSGEPVWQQARDHVSWSSPALIETEAGRGAGGQCHCRCAVR